MKRYAATCEVQYFQVVALFTWASLVAQVWRASHGCTGPAPAQRGGRLQPLALRSSLRSKKWSGQKLFLGVRNLAMAALFLWMFCVRFEHSIKSILLHFWTEYLVGYCCWSKNKPGYPWCMPRFTLAGRDLGEALRSHWRQAGAKAKTHRRVLLTECHSDGHPPCFSRRTRSIGLNRLCWKPST